MMTQTYVYSGWRTRQSEIAPETVRYWLETAENQYEIIRFLHFFYHVSSPIVTQFSGTLFRHSVDHS